VRRALVALFLLCAFSAGVALGAGAEPEPTTPAEPVATLPAPPAPPPTPAVGPPAAAPAFPARPSRALGRPNRGRLVRGVQFPVAGEDHATWDPVLKRVPNRGWRRWGTDRLVQTLLDVLREHRRAHPGAPRVLVGDLSRPRGGSFGARFGGLGHASHQNGLDVDVYYPRRDRRQRAPRRPPQVDRRLANDLVRRFLAAGATHVFVGPRLGLRRPDRRVQPLVHHDDHLHVRLRAR
jgi:murein endopeptidase